MHPAAKEKYLDTLDVQIDQFLIGMSCNFGHQNMKYQTQAVHNHIGLLRTVCLSGLLYRFVKKI